MLCACHTTPTQKLLCLHAFCQAGPPQRVDYLAPKWKTALSVFPKDTATRYRIGSRTKVSQPFDFFFIFIYFFYFYFENIIETNCKAAESNLYLIATFM